MVFLKGALVEYGSDFLGPLPNIVIFQFNPENLKRNIQIPDRVSSASLGSQALGESNQAGEPPLEKIDFTAHFSAAEKLNDNNKLARAMGIGPQLAALEKMVYPEGKINDLLTAAIDKVGDALGIKENEDVPQKPIPRQKYPRILFIWGVSRVLPVVIETMSITEQQYDYLLNPIQAEVDIGLAVVPVSPCSNDDIGEGAYTYSSMAKEVMAISNLANTVEQVMDVIPF